MAVLTVYRPAVGGTPSTGMPTLVAATGGAGDSYPNSGKEMLVINNASGGAVTVTQKQQRACSHGFTTPTHDVTTSVAAGTTEWLPPVNPDRFNDDNNRVIVTYSATASVTVGVVSS